MNTQHKTADFGKTETLWNRWSAIFGNQTRSRRAFSTLTTSNASLCIEHFTKYDYKKDESFQAMSDIEKLVEMVNEFLVFQTVDNFWGNKIQIVQANNTIGYGLVYMAQTGSFTAKEMYWHLCSSTQMYRKARVHSLELLLAYLNELGIGRDKFGEPAPDSITDTRDAVQDSYIAENDSSDGLN